VSWDLRSSLVDAVRGTVITGPEELGRLGRDESHLRGEALAAVQPADSQDVVDLVRWARRHRVGLVPRGAGTSLDGEAVTLGGGVVVDLSAWNTIADISVDRRSVRVGPGVVNGVLQTALRPFGLFYPPNPGSADSCTIGGNVGTNASGPRSFAYGSTRRWVREVEAVLGTGERVRLGSRAEKRSVGPELLHLFIGSEGTLGIATEIILRVAPQPEFRLGWVVPLSEKAPLGPLAGTLARTTGTGLSAIEFLDAFSAEGLRVGRGAAWRAESPLLLLEIEAADRMEVRTRGRRVHAALGKAGVHAEPVVFEDADRLWSLRGENGRVLDERIGPRVREDVAVPLDRVDALVRALHRIAESERVPLYLFGHLGEGSLHPNFAVDPSSPTAARIRAAVYAASLALGGTISAEHGVGRLKRDFLEPEVGEAALRLLRAVRQACDPDGILNPGKLYPEPPAPAALPSPSPEGAEAERARPASPSAAAARRPAARRATPRTRAT
jgi:FAD/FMN-containing dehydrogenase